METLAHPADAAINRRLTKEEKIRFLREMFRIRRFEQTSLKYYNLGKMGGFLHLYSGQEAVAIGTVSLLGENDHLVTAYRDHGHALAVGMDMKACMAELFGKATGCSKGKGGSMHFFAPDKKFWGGHGIVGGQTPLGLGLAFGLKYKGLRGCCLCYLGDGAVNQGTFHESLNVAALFKLPVIYIIENNGYSMGTSQKRSSSFQEALAKRAEGYDMVWDVFKGEDVYEVRAKTQIAIDRAHNDSEPTLLEIQTYRYYGHSVADANAKKYRTPEEIERYKANHDPIRIWSRRLMEEGILTETQIENIDVEAKEETNDAVKFAEGSPFPSEDEILSDVYWEVDHQTDAAKYGRYFFNS
ncbi:MAG: pyruvate dehydrogenase (acetyl-transferring) E1 component subunit alpha [Verrucomicrobia bacterium]|nr:pyruvate dehydrogenase (acetyl-transferring) E1 component subunit alpha [Verrucomicrobiota bacterium]